MASPVADVYTAPAGQTLYAGRFPAPVVVNASIAELFTATATAAAAAQAVAGVAEAVAAGHAQASAITGAPPAPAPPPTPGTTIAALNLLTAGAGTYPWKACHGFRPGDLTAGTLDGLQNNVMTRWPDGSPQTIIICGVTTAASGSTTINLGSGKPVLGNKITTASIGALGAVASVVSSVHGTATWSGTDWDSPFLTQIEGPICSTWSYRKPIGSDTHLVAWLEVSLYSTGDLEVLPWIENGYLSVASPTAKPADYSFVLGGTTRFGPTALPVWHHTRQPLISGSTLSYWLGADKTVTPKHDFAYLEGTGMTDPMLSTVGRNFPPFPANGGVSASFEPYQPFEATNSMHSTNMGSAGGADSIGIQPGWERIAQADNSKLGYEQMLRESFRFGALQIHYRDEATNRPVRFSARANMQINIGQTETATYSIVNVASREDYAGQTSTPAIVGDNGGDPGGGGSVTNARKWARSHQPGSPVLAYLLSGRWWFMEECQHIAAINFLSTPWTRSGTQYHVCKPVRSPARMQMREAAWCFRNLVNALTVTPESDPLRAEYMASVDHNITYYHDRYAPGADMPEGLNPLGLIEHEGNGTTGGDQAWQYDFWVMTWARTIMLRAGGSTAMRVKARAFFDWVSRSIVGRAGGAGATEHLVRSISTSFNTYDPDGAGPEPIREYSSLFPGSNPAVYPNWTRTPGNGPWWPSWGAYYDYNATFQGYTGGRAEGAVFGGYSSDATAWTMFAIVALRMCASLSAPGAVAAMARLEATTDFSWWTSRTSGIWGGDTRPTNAVATRTLPLEQFATYRPAVGKRGNANLNSMTDVDFDAQTSFSAAESHWNGYSQSNSQAGMLGYSGSIWARGYSARGAIIVKGGGHGYNLGQHCYPFNLDTFKWEQVGAPKNFPPNLEWAGWADYRSTSPTAHNPAIDQRVFSPLWYDYNYNGSYIKFDEHSYLQSVYLSPTQGGGVRGSLLLPQTTFHQGPETSDPRTGVSTYWSPHLYDCLDGAMVRAASAPYGPWPGSGYSNTVAVMHTRLNKLWYFVNAGSTAYWLDTSTPAPWVRNTHVVQKVSGGAFGWIAVKNSAYIEVPEADCIVGFAPQNSNEAPPALVNANLYTYLFSMASGVPVGLHTDVSYLVPPQPMPRGGLMVAVAWAPASAVGGVGKFYLYEGYGDDFCYTLTPSTLDFATCSWTWGRERFDNDHTGADPIYRQAFDAANAQIFAPMGKMVYVPDLQSLAWHDGPLTGPRQCFDGATRTGIVQLLRVPGTPI